MLPGTSRNPLPSLLRTLRRYSEPLRALRLHARYQSHATLALHACFTGATEASWCSCAVRQWTSTSPAWNPPFVSLIGKYVSVKGLGVVSCETAAGLICRKANQHGEKESRCSPSYIHDMMSTLSKNNSVEKLAEIDEIGFGFLRLVPNWSVKQAIMVHLAESYQVKQRTFILDIGNIRLNAELIGKVFGLPSRVDPFPVLDDCNPCHVAIKKRFHRRTTTELRDLVYSCPMATESDRMEFRRYFLLVVMKMFLCPTTQQVLSPWHIYPVLDVSDPRRFNWPLETLKWFDKAVEKYKLKGNKMCEGCMFVMLVGRNDHY
ncbi:hypothetical protein Ahy_B08g094323 [Arachis hypogaea]|uniref:Aminotransferase-like plant mobile domain-containing protein n=1 Tax=Arachis hypogaea TaxID=3818 RepID=A0A444Y8J6_ARAHY|nr:hypothetical protein Ahy_B08g094323 [Arachis hypogaea]